MVRAADDFERHACIAALLALADEPFIRGVLGHPSPRVRLAALHLLDQPPFATLSFGDLMGALADKDAGIQAAARRLLERHREWAGSAAPWLREQLTSAELDDPTASALGSLLVTFQSEAAVRQLFSELLDPATPTPIAMRALLLAQLPALTAQEPDPAWLRAVPAALAEPALRAAALQVVASYPQPDRESHLAKLAVDAGVPAAQRLLAARLASRRAGLSDDMFTLAIAALGAAAPAVDRLAAADLLTHSRLTPAQLRRLLSSWTSGVAVSPDAFVPVLTRAVDEASRPSLADFFLARLRSGWSPARPTLDEALRPFSDGSPERVSLLAAWERNRAGMAERLREFHALLAGGDPARGREGFAKATCADCHRVGERGGTAGPDLTRIGAIRSGTDLLESVLYPSSSFAQGFEPHRLIRRDGEEVSGALVAQGPGGVRLRDVAGIVHSVRSEDIASFERQQLSAMPEGLEQLLTSDQFRDLLAYLQSLK